MPEFPRAGHCLSLFPVTNPDPVCLSSELQMHISDCSFISAHLLAMISWPNFDLWLSLPSTFVAGMGCPQYGISAIRKVCTSTVNQVNLHLIYALVYWDLSYHESVLSNMNNSDAANILAFLFSTGTFKWLTFPSFFFLGGGSCSVACGILVPRSETEPRALAVRALSSCQGIP